YQLLMVSHGALGQLSRAAAWYAAALRMMRRELDAEVSRQTRETFLRILDDAAGDAEAGRKPDPASFAQLVQALDVDRTRGHERPAAWHPGRSTPTDVAAALSRASADSGDL